MARTPPPGLIADACQLSSNENRQLPRGLLETASTVSHLCSGRESSPLLHASARKSRRPMQESVEMVAFRRPRQLLRHHNSQLLTTQNMGPMLLFCTRSSESLKCTSGSEPGPGFWAPTLASDPGHPCPG